MVKLNCCTADDTEGIAPEEKATISMCACVTKVSVNETVLCTLSPPPLCIRSSECGVQQCDRKMNERVPESCGSDTWEGKSSLSLRRLLSFS